MVNNRTRGEWIDLFITQFLMEPKNLPYTIQTRKCPENDNQCTKPHPGMVIGKYYEKNNNFLGNLNKWHQIGEEKIFETQYLKDLLLEGIRFRIFSIIDLKKKLDLSSILRNEVLQTRVTIKEKDIIENNAKSKKMDISEYLRQQALLLNSSS